MATVSIITSSWSARGRRSGPDCPGFCARELSKAEWDIVTDEIGVARGIVNSNEVADDYSEIRRHLGKVMEEASAR